MEYWAVEVEVGPRMVLEWLLAAGCEVLRSWLEKGWMVSVCLLLDGRVGGERGGVQHDRAVDDLLVKPDLDTTF